MADNDKQKFDIPWATLLPIMAALAGIIAQFRPLVSARPGIPSEKPSEVVAAQDVDARLWQDPLAVAQKAKAQLDADLLAKHVPKTRVLGHQIDSLVSRVREPLISPRDFGKRLRDWRAAHCLIQMQACMALGLPLDQPCATTGT